MVVIFLIAFIGFAYLNLESDPKADSTDTNYDERKEVINIDKVEKKRQLERDINDPPKMDASAVYSFYYEEGEKEILFSLNRHEKLPIASITKLVTGLIVYEDYSLNEPVGVADSDYLDQDNFSDLRIFRDTPYRELLYQLLLESNNSSAYAAAVTPEDIEFDDFVNMMNERVNELGMSRTFFYNPSGLDNLKGVNYSTARDLGVLTVELLDYPKFWEILQKTEYEIHSNKSDLHYKVETTNKFLDESYFFKSELPKWHDDILGGKTGFTHQAMGCLVMVLEVEDGYLVNIILGAEGRIERFEEMEKLIDWAYRSYNF